MYVSYNYSHFKELKSNQIYVPAGILQSPTFSTDHPAYINYGAIGFIIGHELTHAFDVQGATRNARGQVSNWWSNQTLTNFNSKTQCMVDQYSKYSMTFNNNQTRFVNG